MIFHIVDMHGIKFETRAGVLGFIARGALQDLGGLGRQVGGGGVALDEGGEGVVLHLAE